MVRGEVCVRVPVSESVRARVFLWGVRNEPQTVSFTQLTNTLIRQCPGRRRNTEVQLMQLYFWIRMQSSAAKKPAAAQETLYSTHIIDCKLIPKNLALLVLTHILDCDSQHFEACPFSSVWGKICSEDGEGKIACGTYMGRFKIVTSTADQWTQYTHGWNCCTATNSANLCQATEDNFTK